MINLDYKLSFAAPLDLRGATEEQLHYELFCGDIIFQVNNVDFSTDWGWVPVLDFSVTLARLILSLSKSPKAAFEFTESESVIEFELINNKVNISASYTESLSTVLYEEFIDVSNIYLTTVLSDLSKKHPSLKENKIFISYCKEFKKEGKGRKEGGRGRVLT